MYLKNINIYLFIYLIIRLAAFLTQTVSLEDATVKFEIWDTAGQGILTTPDILLLYLIMTECIINDRLYFIC